MKKEVDYEEVVQKAAQGDRQARELLYKETCQSVYFLARNMVKSDEEAMDIVHDSYLCVFQSLDSIKNKSGFKSYLRTTVANRCKNYLKKIKPMYLSDMTEDGEELEIEDTEGTIPGELLENSDVIECVRKVIASLPEEQRMCVILRYYDNMPLQEIADTMEISLGTVKSRLNRANKKMREEIERMEKEENKKFRCIIPFFWLRAGLEGMEEESNVPKALEVKIFGKAIRKGVSSMARNIIVAAAALAIVGGVFLTACGADEGKKNTTSSLADTSSVASVSSAVEESSSEAEEIKTKELKCELDAGSELTADELAAKLSEEEIKSAAFVGIDDKLVLDKLGDQTVTLNVTYPDASEEIWNITVTVVDTEKPVFEGIKDKYEITEGDKLPDFKKGVSVKDNYDESVEFTAELDSKAKDSDYKAGDYTITYKAKDSSGNEVTATSKLVIKEKPEEKKEEEKQSEETSDNNNDNGNNGGGSNSNNNNGGGSNGGGNNNNDGGSNNNNGGGSNNNDGGSSNNNGGSNSNNNDGGSSDNNDGGSSGGNDAPCWDYGNNEWKDNAPDTTGWVRQHGDPFGLGWEYDYVYNPSTGECALH